jgi:hypothetical protein
VPLSDWYYTTAFEANERAQTSAAGPPIADNILVNGKHKSGIKDGKQTGEYFKMTVKKVSGIASSFREQNLTISNRARSIASD